MGRTGVKGRSLLGKIQAASFLIAVFLFSGKAIHADHGDFIFMYSDHEPYIIATNHGFSGFLANYIKQVTSDANITPHWSNTPWEKQLLTLRRNAPNICAVTLYKTVERETFLRFTAPVGKNGGFALISVKNNTRLVGHKVFKTVTEDKDLVPVLQAKTVYNPYIDKLVAHKGFPEVNSSFARIARSRINSLKDYFIIADVRARAFIKKEDIKDKLAIYDHYPDLRSDTNYYIACSMATDDVLFNRMNDAIKRRGLVVPD